MSTWIACETCGLPVEAELTHNGIMACLHYVHCGWGHMAHPDDGKPTAEAVWSDLTDEPQP